MNEYYHNVVDAYKSLTWKSFALLAIQGMVLGLWISPCWFAWPFLAPFILTNVIYAVLMVLTFFKGM